LSRIPTPRSYPGAPAVGSLWEIDMEALHVMEPGLPILKRAVVRYEGERALYGRSERFFSFYMLTPYPEERIYFTEEKWVHSVEWNTAWEARGRAA